MKILCNFTVRKAFFINLAFVIFYTYLITERFLAIYIKPLVHQLQTAYEFDYTRALSNKYLSKQKLHRSLNTRLITIIKKLRFSHSQSLEFSTIIMSAFYVNCHPLSLRLPYKEERKKKYNETFLVFDGDARF